MKKPFATIILAGGKGTRMGSSDRHKVCFEVLGTPVIIRALETYNLCGAALNVIVVGMMAESVMATVNRRFPGTAYAFQDQQLGTGDATRKGSAILESLKFAGDVLVVAGDKVIEPKVIRKLLAAHETSRADVTLATAKRPAKSSAGILLKSKRGNVVGILEDAERERLEALAAISAVFESHPSVFHGYLLGLLREHCSEKTARRLAGELGISKDAEESGRKEGVLKREEFARIFSEEERHGLVRVGKERVRARGMLERFDQMNMSTYVFRALVLFEALSRLKSTRPSHEEYLTDVFHILANRDKPAKIVGCEIEDPHDLMAFNNPQELLAIEEAYRAREGQKPVTAMAAHFETATPARWENWLRDPAPATRKQFHKWYGDDIPWERYGAALDSFARRYGADRPVAVVRSPGRINLMGRHIDHQGGTVNVMAVNREILMVAAPRPDDVVSLTNADGEHFAEETFRISDLVANLNWDDWQGVVDGPRLQRMLEAARGDWANYVKASILRLQEQFRDRRLQGLDIMVSGNIPMGAGLSSSSALVVATAEAVRLFNHLPVSARRLVSLCGEGEWFVGTRGGAADHAAIKLAQRGCVTRVSFFPFKVGESAAFLPDHDLVACNSGVYAGKSHHARNTFNAKVTAYHLGRAWLKMSRPDLAPRIEHLRDITPEHLGLTRARFATLLGELPARLTRAKALAAMAQMAECERDRLERLFHTHEAPPEGYPVRDVVVFGLSEMSRAKRCLDFLRKRDARGLGRFMAFSHDGDRVARETGRNTWKRSPAAEDSRELTAWSTERKRDGDLAELSGSYACSLPELDRIVDIARKQEGVEGAQLAGAGLGGCIMVLVQKRHTAGLLATLSKHEISAEVFQPIAGACSLSAG